MYGLMGLCCCCLYYGSIFSVCVNRMHAARNRIYIMHILQYTRIEARESYELHIATGHIQMAMNAWQVHKLVHAHLQCAACMHAAQQHMHV